MKNLSLLLIVVAAVGCKKKEASDKPSEVKPTTVETKPAEPKPAETKPVETPPTTGSAKAQEPHAAAPFLKDVKAKPTTAKVGQLAWTIHGNAYDSADTYKVEVDEVLAVDGNTVTTRELKLMSSGPDSWKHKPNPDERPFGGLPGQLVIPARTVDEVKPKVGDPVFVFIGNSDTPGFAKVKAVADGIVTVELPNAMGNKVEETKTDLIEPYGTGLAPWTYVTYKEGDDQKLATVLAVDGDSVLAFGFGGKLVTLKKANVKSLKLEPKSRKVGDKIFGFSNGDGKADAIKTVVVPDALYKFEYSTIPWDQAFDKLP